MLLEMAGEDDGKRLNDIQRELDMDVFDIRDTNEYHKKGKALKRDYERLHRLATNQPVESPFNEPKARVISTILIFEHMDCRLLGCGNLPWSLNLSQRSWQASDRNWSEQNKTIFYQQNFNNSILGSL